MPTRERYLFVCTNERPEGHPKGSCAASGSAAVLTALKDELVKQGLHKRLRACGTGCLDLCESGVSVVQEPDHVVYGGVKPEDAADIVSAAARGEVCERLKVPAAS